MNDNKHNGIISFWKFMFSLLICAYHAGRLHGTSTLSFASGSIGVEFFFIVSGYLFCKKCLKYNDNNIFEDNLKITWNKIKRFFPYVLLLTIVAIPFCKIILNYRWIDLIYAFYNVLQLPVYKATISLPFGILWYITALLIVEFIIFPILVKYKDAYRKYIAPIISFLLTGYLLIKYNKIVDPWKNDIFTYETIVRAFLDINIGIFVYTLCESFRKIKFNGFSRVVLSLIEIYGYLSIFYLCNAKNAHTKYDVLMIIIISISVMISFSNFSVFNKLSNNKVFYYLEKLSLPIYINQWVVILGVDYILKNPPYYKLASISIILLIIISIVELSIIKICSKYKNKISLLFIKE